MYSLKEIVSSNVFDSKIVIKDQKKLKFNVNKFTYND